MSCSKKRPSCSPAVARATTTKRTALRSRAAGHPPAGDAHAKPDTTARAQRCPSDAPRRFVPIPAGMTFAPAPRYAFEYELEVDGNTRVRQRFEFATLVELAAFYGAFMAQLRS